MAKKHSKAAGKNKTAGAKVKITEPAKRKRGRPALPADQRRDDIVALRMTPELRAAVERVAAARGVTVSAVLLHLIENHLE